MKTFDLGHGWYFNLQDDGSATFRNPGQGQRIELPKSSVETLKSLFRVNYKRVAA